MIKTFDYYIHFLKDLTRILGMYLLCNEGCNLGTVPSF